ncbi:MAG: aminotransferase class III-fold pyridoxal phosphate-dependent enzyme [Pyrinomonadaceae bacterium]
MIIFHIAKLLLITSAHLGGYLFAAARTSSGHKRAEVQAKWLRNYLVRLGPVYIKMGQIIATRSDLIPEEWVSTLRTLQDAAPHMNEAQTIRQVEQELGQPIDRVFKEFCVQPIASASIAQVHKATLHDGRRAAVKLVKKDIPRQIDSNLRVITCLVRLVHAIAPSARRLNLPKRLDELKGLIVSQADMKHEAERQEIIHANFQGHSFVRVPAVYKQLSSSGMLVMEFMEGISGKDVHLVRYPRCRLAQRLQDTIYTMLYMHGLCHGDTHPGNLFFTEDGNLILLDFGITVELSEDEKWGLSSFYYACMRKEWDIAVERFTKHFVTNTDRLKENWSSYSADIEKILQWHFDTHSTRWSTIAYFKDINTVLLKYDALYTTNFTKVELVFLSCEGFATQIDPEIDIWKNARIFTDRYSPYIGASVKRTFDTYFEKNIPSSLAMRDTANDFMVAPTHMHRYFFPSAYPLFVKTASRGHITDVDDNCYVDLSSGYGPHILGYAHPAITEALSARLNLGFVNALGNDAEVELAQLIVEAFAPGGKAILCNSGTEAVLVAVRLCRAYRRRSRVAKLEGHFHGFSDMGMVSSWFRFAGSKYKPQPIAGTEGSDRGTVENTLVLQYGHIDGLERLREEADTLACIICEPMPSSLANYDKEFLQALRSLCTELDIPLIFDEVVTGFRVAYGGSQTLMGIVPDLTCVGKIIGGGLPCGGVVGLRKLIEIARSSEDPFFDYENKVFVGGTMSGNTLSCTAGVAALKHLKQHPEIYVELDTKTNWLASEFREIAARKGISCRVNARNSIFSLNFTHRTAKFYRDKLAGSNFKATIALAYYMRKYSVYMPELHSFLLSAAHTQEDLETIAVAFDQSLEEMLADGLFVV